MGDIIKRVSGYSNKWMADQCEILRRIVLNSVEVKVGRGKNIEIYRKMKHRTDKDTMDRILKSCEHYKKLYEMESKVIGSLEIVKYRFEKINGEPKIIIEMIKVLDTNGDYIKFAKLEGVVNFLSKYPVKFK